jgi:hypothetical protein
MGSVSSIAAALSMAHLVFALAVRAEQGGGGAELLH